MSITTPHRQNKNNMHKNYIIRYIPPRQKKNDLTCKNFKHSSSRSNSAVALLGGHPLVQAHDSKRSDMKALILISLVALAATEDQTVENVDPNGYVMFCPCMGKFTKSISSCIFIRKHLSLGKLGAAQIQIYIRKAYKKYA